jgi:predicted enzyme related to lactoylglutathione lyase
MSENKMPIGSIGWIDLTIQDAPAIRDFYSQVVGWKAKDVPMGEYNDYNMNSPDNGQPIAGICHARGINAALPPVWLIYITVKNLDDRLESCQNSGGKVISGPKTMEGQGRYAVIQDPAGAYAALFEEI